jgi:hypothetical protein
MSRRTIDNLVDGVDRFALTGAAAENEHLGYEVEVRIIRVVVTLRFTIFPKNNAWNADRFPAVAAENSPEMDGPCNGGH